MGWVALGMAVFGALSYGVGSILQAIGAMRSSGTVRTLGHPLYLLGVGCDLLAWAASMVALRELAVYQVQSVLAGSLAVTVVAARLVLASRLRGRDVGAVVVTIGALTVLTMSAGPQEAVPPSGPLRLGFCVAALAVAVVGYGATKVASPGVVAVLAGTAFGGAALAGRALPMPEESPNMLAFALALVTEPMTVALVVFAASGMLLYTNALQHGQVGPVTAVLWIGEVVAPSAVGLAVLGDSVRTGWNLPAAAAGVILIGAAVVLASAPASHATARTEAALVPVPVAALEVARSPLWPTLAAQAQGHVRPFVDDRLAATIRWWGVARGYHRRPGLTADRFRPDPWTPGGRLYRTGDLVRERADGVFEFISRADDQVKIRGHRVEPREVETVLSRHPAVSEAVVLPHTPPGGDRRLVAYVVAPGAEPAGLRAFAAAELPDHMVPSVFVPVDRIPLSPNGKADRRGLPDPGDAAPVARAPSRPLGTVEQAVALVWSEVLGVPVTAPDDEFFSLGGHSLVATRAMTFLREALDTEVPLRLLFAHPTLAGFAAALTTEHGAAVEAAAAEFVTVAGYSDADVEARLTKLST